MMLACKMEKLEENAAIATDAPYNTIIVVIE
jgi:hypothetical protein